MPGAEVSAEGGEGEVSIGVFVGLWRCCSRGCRCVLHIEDFDDNGGQHRRRGRRGKH